MNLKIIICDDEEQQSSFIKTLLNEYRKQHTHSIETIIFPSAESFLFYYMEDKSADIILLDIEMSGMNGIELAKQIRESNHEIQIIFITGYMEYIAAGYDVEALHYLLKPVDSKKLFPVLDRACERLKNREKTLIFSSNGETVRLPLYEIKYIEVIRNYVTLHADSEYIIKQTLKEVESKLDHSFQRTGRSYIVNLHYIKKIGKDTITLKNNTLIPISRGYYEKLNRAMIEYF